MARIVHARRDFIDQQGFGITIAEDEQLHRQNTDVAKGFGDRLAELAGRMLGRAIEVAGTIELWRIWFSWRFSATSKMRSAPSCALATITDSSAENGTKASSKAGVPPIACHARASSDFPAQDELPFAVVTHAPCLEDAGASEHGEIALQLQGNVDVAAKSDTGRPKLLTNDFSRSRS